jgi:hypothetical protein
LYKPAHSPFIPVVKRGPEVSKFARNLSGLNGRGNDAVYRYKRQTILCAKDKNKYIVSKYYFARTNILLKWH